MRNHPNQKKNLYGWELKSQKELSGTRIPWSWLCRDQISVSLSQYLLQIPQEASRWEREDPGSCLIREWKTTCVELCSQILFHQDYLQERIPPGESREPSSRTVRSQTYPNQAWHCYFWSSKIKETRLLKTPQDPRSRFIRLERQGRRPNLEVNS